MSSDVENLKILQASICTPIIIITIIGYDYLLTFTREVNTIWCRPWTLVSSLFVVARYVGLSWTVALAIAGNAAFPGPIEAWVPVLAEWCYNADMQVGNSGIRLEGIAVLEIGDWGYLLFLAAADMVMILRVYAMWNQSKKILGILLFIYIPQLVVIIVWELVYVFPGKTLIVSIGSISVVSTDQVLNYKSCNYPTPTAPLATYKAIPQFVLGSVMLILAIIPTMSQMVEMYNLTKRWEINRLLKLLVKEGTVYFIVNLLFNIVNATHVANFYVLVPLDSLCYALTCAIVPRFIINIREVYDGDPTNRWKTMDTGFGISFTPGATSIDARGMSSIMLEDASQDESRGSNSVGMELEEMKPGVGCV